MASRTLPDEPLPLGSQRHKYSTRTPAGYQGAGIPRPSFEKPKTSILLRLRCFPGPVGIEVKPGPPLEPRHSGQLRHELDMPVSTPPPPTICSTSKDAGAASRRAISGLILAPHLGAPVINGSASERAAAPGQPSVAQLVRDYGFCGCAAPAPPLRPRRPAGAALASPRLHNAADPALGLSANRLPRRMSSSSRSAQLVRRLRGPRLCARRGSRTTTPQKEVAFAVAGATSPLSERLQAVNTLTPARGLGGRTDRRRRCGRGVARERRGAARSPASRSSAAALTGRGVGRWLPAPKWCCGSRSGARHGCSALAACRLLAELAS